jgi:Fe-S cluster assembly iron-binding protein IscA
MLTVTDRAATELQELLAVNKAAPGQAVKLIPNSNNSISLSIGAAGENDQVIRRGDEVLLIVDSRLATALDGAQVDCETAMVEGQPRAEFKLRTSS